jgi:ubiquinone/menaquinone biosynthesis C-methylase UbiE
MNGRCREVWAVDQEPDMIDVARQKATAAGISSICFLTSAAEDLSAPDDSFDLIPIKNAFHRMQRESVAARVFRWLRPGQFIALLWGRIAVGRPGVLAESHVSDPGTVAGPGADP